MEIDDFCCPICENVYDEEKHIPRLLMKCGHTYCEICIENQIAANDSKRKFVCKEDNETYEKIESINDIPKNLSLLNLLKKAKLRSNYNDLCNSAVNSVKNPNFGLNKLNNACDKSNFKLKSFTPADYSTMNFSFMSSSTSNNQNNANLPFNNTSPGFFSGGADKFNNNNNSSNASAANNNTSKNINSLLTSRDSLQRKTSNNNPTVNEFNLEAANSNNFSENEFNLSNINNNNNNKNSNYCFAHKRKTEIVCLDDKVKICTSCALFGDHKNHNLKSEEDLNTEMFIKSEILIEYFEMMENFDAKIKEFKNPEYQKTIEKLKAEADYKQNKLKESVASIFKEIRFVIKEREEFVLDQITTSFVEQVNNKVLYFEKNLDPLSERIFNWKKE